MKNTELDNMSYMGISVFFLNLVNDNKKFVYEVLANKSIQIYTTCWPEELPFVFDRKGWSEFRSIEVYTTNIWDEDKVKDILETYPELRVKSGFV